MSARAALRDPIDWALPNALNAHRAAKPLRGLPVDCSPGAVKSLGKPAQLATKDRAGLALPGVQLCSSVQGAPQSPQMCRRSQCLLVLGPSNSQSGSNGSRNMAAKAARPTQGVGVSGIGPPLDNS
jgi:hypothetical protein